MEIDAMEPKMFLANGLPTIMRIMGSPGFDWGKSMNRNDLEPGQSAADTHWGVAHWKVRHSHVAEPASIYSVEQSNSSLSSDSADESSQQFDFRMAPTAIVREEDFGCVIALGPNVYAMNRQGQRLLELARKMSVEEIVEKEKSIEPSVIFTFVGTLCSIGLLLPQ